MILVLLGIGTLDSSNNFEAEVIQVRRNPSDKDVKLNDKLFAKISKLEYTS